MYIKHQYQLYRARRWPAVLTRQALGKYFCKVALLHQTLLSGVGTFPRTLNMYSIYIYRYPSTDVY